MVLFGDARNPSCACWAALGGEPLPHPDGTFSGNSGWRDLRRLARVSRIDTDGVRLKPLPRCAWAQTPLSVEYHDREWGVPVHDDRILFEFLTLEGAQAGLSWETILRKREGYRSAFAGFDPAAVARFTPAVSSACCRTRRSSGTASRSRGPCATRARFAKSRKSSAASRVRVAVRRRQAARESMEAHEHGAGADRESPTRSAATCADADSRSSGRRSAMHSCRRSVS